jgi:cyclic pyranopterin phosphate synthase
MITDKFSRSLKDLRISITDKCNFRCTYCMPAEIFGARYHFLPKDDILTFEEITRLTRIFVDLGVTKVRLTGGEPLLRQDLHLLVAMLADINGIEDLTLTTNGYLLAQQAQKLKDSGLQRITISLDSLNEQIFQKLNGRGFSTQTVLQGIDQAKAVGLSPIKINSVVQKGINDHTVVDLARHFKGTGLIVRFIEYMDVGNLNGWKWDDMFSANKIIQLINAEMPLDPLESNYPGEVVRRYRYRDGSGEIGVIASVSQPFCGDCTRARLSTDGKLYTCLFAGQGFNLRDSMRAGASNAELLNSITGTWNQRVDRYSEERRKLVPQGKTRHKIEMYQIGG